MSELQRSVDTAERALAELEPSLPMPREELERARDEAEQEVRRLESAFRDVALTEAQTQDAHADVSHKLASTRGAVHRMEARLHETAADLISTMTHAVGPGGNSQALVDSVNQIIAEEMAVKSLETEVQSLVAIEAENEEMFRLTALRREQESISQDFQTLARAKERFSDVSTALLRRANAEEAAAFTQQRSAIQECFRALLPHKHLDEVTIDPQTGAVLITDYLLQRRSRLVKAHNYLSTGQANALAVSIFTGMALRQRISLFDFLLMDEPVQNLDDLHFLAFMSLAKHLALDRQVVFSTADASITEIFRRQVKSSWSQRPDDYSGYEWTDFSPLQGPTIIPHSV